MIDLLVIIALLTLAAGLRMSKQRFAKKFGALAFVVSMAYLGYALTGTWLGAVISTIILALLPLFFIYHRLSKQRYPLDPQPLTAYAASDESFYPHASQYRAQLEKLDFDEVDEESWSWLDSEQHHRFLWHPEYNTIASICLCEREKIAFSYVIFYSELADGTTIKTTNYPFSSPLIHPPNSHWTHVPCEEKKIAAILRRHQAAICKHNTNPCSVITPDPEIIPKKWTAELTRQTDYNLSKKLIKADQQEFSYTPLGFLYLWMQAIRDFIRLC